MRVHVFLDLDGTLFQTRPKCPPGVVLSTAALRRDGTPLSFMTPRQARLLELLRSADCVIPTTARNLDAFRRVQLPFSSLAILDFGGLILLSDGSPDPEWDSLIRPQAHAIAPELKHRCEVLLAFIETHHLGVNVRLINDLEMPLYLVMKHPEGKLDALARIRHEALADLDTDRFGLHDNDNNLSVVPRFLGKERAVEHVIRRHLGKEPALTIGVGDSFSDAAFLGVCDYALLPRCSQLGEFLIQQCTPGDPLMFSGSYLPDDVTFLLKRVTLAPTPVEEKELLIQSGRKHYSEMISAERLPSPLYLRVFHQALERQKTRFARHLIDLANLLHHSRPGPLTLVSLATAGTPIGVLLARILRQRSGRPVTHYSISIIRDRGIDTTALRYILERHEPESIAFVDGWTGKGVIARELLQSIQRFNEQEEKALDPGLHVVADLCGEAAVAATAEDYLIPSSVLGCTISGLVSRSILNEEVVEPGDFHGCVYYDEFQAHDLSRWFVDTIMNEVARIDDTESNSGVTPDQRQHLRQRNAGFLQDVAARYGVRDVNHIKPGIGEATRVLLRRLPDRLLLRDPDHADVEHLRVLAEEKGVAIEIDPQLPYLAAALIREIAR